MATFRAGKLARKKKGRFQSTTVKSRTENFLDSRKRKSSDGLGDATKVSFQSECESETVLSGRRVVELGLLSKELADGCNYFKVLYSCQTVGRKLYLDLAAFSILAYGKAFTGESARQVTYL